MRRVKLKEILESGSCYSEDRIRELVGKRKSVSLKNVLDCKDLSDADKGWAFSRLSFVDDRDKRLFACACAESVLHIYEAKYPGDNRPRQATEVARRYATGEATAAELSAARAASAAARAASAAASAAWAASYAASDAARAAASDAASYAASYAAWAASYAASDAAWAAARAEQVQLIRRFCETGQWDRLAGGEE